MKKIFLFIVIGLGSLSVYAQQQAEAAFSESTAQAFDVNGIKVIFKTTTKKVMDVRLYIKGGTTNYPSGQAGIEGLALAAATQCGTTKYAPAAFRDTASAYGILLSGTSFYDEGHMELNCISKYFDLGWALFTEAVMNPVFDAGEVELLKTKTIAINKNYMASPESEIRQLQMQHSFENTPYADMPSGTEETLSKLTNQDLKQYYNTQLNKNKIFIVIVGNLTKQEVFEKVLASFSNIPSRPYSPVSLETPIWNDNKLITKNRQLPVGYVSGIVNAPQYTDINYVPYQLAVMGVAGNFYGALQAESNIASATSAKTYLFKMPFAMLTASTTHPKELIDNMVEQLKHIQNDGFSSRWLQHIKNSYITRSYINEQSASSIANSLGMGEILGGWQYADDFTKLVQITSVEQVNQVLSTYIAGIRWTYLGDTEAVEGFSPPKY